MRNEQILQNLGPNALAFGGGAAFLHPNDILCVVEKLKKLETDFYNAAHSAGSVRLSDQKIEWAIQQEGSSRMVVLRLNAARG